MLPVSRRVAVETMPDPVVSVDSNRLVVDANPAAKRLFGVNSGDVTGTTLEEFCAAYPTVPSLCELGTKQTTEVSLDTDAGTRHFSMYLEPIRQSGSTTGSLLVLREVTTLQEREQELDLLKKVLSRVFRHNIRNRLNVIEGHTRALASSTTDEPETHVETILNTVDQLLSHSDKAVAMRKIIDTETGDTPLSIGTVVRQQAAVFREANPEISVAVDCPDEITALCHPSIDKAVAELLDNAVQHAEGPLAEFTVRITVARREGMIALVIEDNGPSIGTHEIDALNAGGETDLNHGSGVGLWLVRLLVEKSGGTLTIDDQTDLGGTRVELRLPSPVSTDSHPQKQADTHTTAAATHS